MENFPLATLIVLTRNMEDVLFDLKMKWDKPTKPQINYLHQYEKQLISRKAKIEILLKLENKVMSNFGTLEHNINQDYPKLNKANENSRKNNQQIKQSPSDVFDLKLSWV